MANIWMDRNENMPMPNFLPVASAKKQQQHHQLTNSSMRKQKILGELNNKPLHQTQQHLAVELKDVLPTVLHSAIKSKSLRHDVLRKEHMKQSDVKVQAPLPAPAPTPKRTSDAENLFEYWDVPSVCCTGNCQKSDQQIWSDATNVFDDELVDKLLKHINGSIFDDSDSDYESGNDSSIILDFIPSDHDVVVDSEPLRLLPTDDGDDSLLFDMSVELPNDDDIDWDDDAGLQNVVF